MRLKPRENPDVNQWWMCDEGRYGYKPIDFNRIKEVKAAGRGAAGGNGHSPDSAWLSALEAAAVSLKRAKSKKDWAVLISAQATNEEAFLMKKIFRDHFGLENMAFKSSHEEGSEDGFLLKKDKNPNTSGCLQILKINERSADISPLIEKAKRGELEGLFVFRHDLEKAFGLATLQAIRQKVKTLIFEGPNENSTAASADIVFPSASYAEKEGTFTNFEGRVQRIRKAVDPMGVSRPTWRILLDLAALGGLTLSYKKPEDIFNDLASENEAFRDLTYKKIGDRGVIWNRDGGRKI
jgi:NADH-quinone oxidoreductase subunit G